MDTNRLIVVKGSWYTVEWALTRSSPSPAQSFFEELGLEDKAKVLDLLELFANQQRICNKEKFKKLQEGLFQFKSFQIRLIGDYRPKRRFILAMGLRKKQDRHNPKDLEKARRILVEHDELSDG